MVDGSHRWKEIGADDSMTRHFAERDRDELEQVLAENAAFNGAEVRKVPMVIPKGHMSFHHCRTYHGSGANRSGRPRRAVSFHLQDGANEYRRFALERRRRGGVQPRRAGAAAPRTGGPTTRTRSTARCCGATALFRRLTHVPLRLG